MLRFYNTHSYRGRLVRREFLRAGALGLAGLGLAGSGDRTASAAAHRLLKDRSIIFLFMHGGPSQFETFDPKMDMPSSIRSATGEIATSLSGVTFGSTFEGLAKRADKLSVVRSFVTGNGNHDIKPIMSPETLNANLGSLYARVAGPLRAATAMPTNVALFPRAVNAEAGPAINSFGNFESAGPLGSAFAPFVPGAAAPGAGGLEQDLKLNLAANRLEDRRALLTALDSWKRSAAAKAAAGQTDSLQQLAFDALLSSVSDAFDLKQEDARLVEQYDTASRFPIARIDKKWNNYQHYKDHGTTIGKLLLMARRLCERGCGFVTVTTSFVWDMHADVNNATMTEGMDYVGRPFDHAVSTLIDDLEARGLSDKIMLVCCGEMGRTPTINKAGGRDHWGNLAPLLIYGGGSRRGQVIGQSSRDGGTPNSDPFTIPDLIATIMHKLLDLDQARVTAGLPRNLLDVLSRGKPLD